VRAVKRCKDYENILNGNGGQFDDVSQCLRSGRGCRLQHGRGSSRCPVRACVRVCPTCLSLAQCAAGPADITPAQRPPFEAPFDISAEAPLRTASPLRADT